MKPCSVVSFLFLAGVLGTANGLAQEDVQPGIPNWPAPLLWSPPQDARGPRASQEEKAPGGVRPLRIEAASSPLPFVAITPCRIVDTRGPTGTFGAPSLPASTPRNFPLPTGPCAGIPTSVSAYSLNITVTNTLGPGFISIYPQGGAAPLVSTLNYLAGQTLANAAIVPAGTSGGVTVIAGVSGTDLIIDINGYYAGGVVTSVNGLTGDVTIVASRRASLRQWWTTTPNYDTNLGLTPVGTSPVFLESDGADVWVANISSSTVSRVRASDGKNLETWTGATGAWGVLVAIGRVFATGDTVPGRLHMIDPRQPAGAVMTVASNLGNNSQGIAFDGSRIWTANFGGSVSIVTPNATTPWPVTTVGSGFVQPGGILFDGSNIWVTDQGDNKLKKLNGSGGILQSVSVGSNPLFPAFDGKNIWVPNINDNTVTVVRASDGAVLSTLSGNGLNFPLQVAFDGQRMLVTNNATVSLFKAADLSPIGNFGTSTHLPFGACSDGVNFWISLQDGFVGRY